MTALPFRTGPEGVLLAVRLIPRARSNAVTSVMCDPEGRAALAIKIAAPPVEGAANKALILYLAELLDTPKSSFTIRSGDKARHKIVNLAGDADAIIARLERVMATLT